MLAFSENEWWYTWEPHLSRSLFVHWVLQIRVLNIGSHIQFLAGCDMIRLLICNEIRANLSLSLFQGWLCTSAASGSINRPIKGLALGPAIHHLWLMMTNFLFKALVCFAVESCKAGNFWLKDIRSSNNDRPSGILLKRDKAVGWNVFSEFLRTQGWTLFYIFSKGGGDCCLTKIFRSFLLVATSSTFYVYCGLEMLFLCIWAVSSGLKQFQIQIHRKKLAELSENQAF